MRRVLLICAISVLRQLRQVGSSLPAPVLLTLPGKLLFAQHPPRSAADPPTPTSMLRMPQTTSPARIMMKMTTTVAASGKETLARSAAEFF